MDDSEDIKPGDDSEDIRAEIEEKRRKQVSTRAGAEAQVWTLPARYDGWFHFAHLIDGYRVAIDMGYGDLREWGRDILDEFDRTGQWAVESVLDLRLLLFYKAREMRFTSGPEYAVFRVVNSLLKEIARRTGQTYDDPKMEAFFAEEATRWQSLDIVEWFMNSSRGVIGTRPVDDSEDPPEESGES